MTAMRRIIRGYDFLRRPLKVGGRLNRCPDVDVTATYGWFQGPSIGQE
jgi:hypothetical protein